MTYGDGNVIKRSEAVRTGKWRVELAVEMLEPRLIPAIHSQLESLEYNPHLYHYLKNGKWALWCLPIRSLRMC